MQSSPAEKDLGLLVCERLDVPGNVLLQPRKAIVSWAAAEEMCAQGRGGGILPLCSVLVRHTWSVQLWGSQHRRDMLE